MSQLTQDGRAADGPLDPAEIAPPESAPAAPQDRSSGHPSMLRMLLRDRFACTGAVILVLVFLTAMKELPATLLLRPTGFETLATRIWTSSSAGLYSRAAVPALLIVLLSAIPLSALARRIGVTELRGD